MSLPSGVREELAHLTPTTRAGYLISKTATPCGGVNSTPTRVEFGIGTSPPTEALHIATPQTPRILLDSKRLHVRDNAKMTEDEFVRKVMWWVIAISLILFFGGIVDFFIYKWGQ